MNNVSKCSGNERVKGAALLLSQRSAGAVPAEGALRTLPCASRFDVVGYGCMTCIGNSGPLPEPVVEAITQVTKGLWVFRAVVSSHMMCDQNTGHFKKV